MLWCSRLKDNRAYISSLSTMTCFSRQTSLQKHMSRCIQVRLRLDTAYVIAFICSRVACSPVGLPGKFNTNNFGNAGSPFAIALSNMGSLDILENVGKAPSYLSNLLCGWHVPILVACLHNKMISPTEHGLRCVRCPRRRRQQYLPSENVHHLISE